MFITFEGIEGSGKSTLITRLETYLTDKGAAVVRTREPGGSRLGRELRAILLDPANTDIRPEAELFLYLADRAQHVGSLIRPALENGKTVLCDRYADSTVVYQGYGRGLDPDHLFTLNDAAVSGLWPDLTFLLDLEPETGLARARGRNAESDLEDSEGRFEAESLAFHTRIREGYLAMAERHSGRYRVLDGSLLPDEVFEAARRVLETEA